MGTRAGLGTPGVVSVRAAHLHTTTSTAGHMNTPAYVNRFPPDWDSQLRPFTPNLRQEAHIPDQGHLLDTWLARHRQTHLLPVVTTTNQNQP